MNICIQNLEKLYESTNNIITLLTNKKKLIDFNDIINKLQQINNDLSSNFRLYGTKSIEYVLDVCFGNEYINDNINENNSYLYEVVKKYIHPINYKVLDWKDDNNKNEKNKAKISKESHN